MTSARVCLALIVLALGVGACSGASTIEADQPAGAADSTSDASPTSSSVPTGTDSSGGLALWVDEDFEAGPGVMQTYSDGLTTYAEEGRYWMANTTGGMMPSPVAFPESSSIKVRVDVIPPNELVGTEAYTDAFGVLLRESTERDAASYQLEIYPPGAIEERGVVGLIRSRVNPSGEREGEVLSLIHLDELKPASIEVTVTQQPTSTTVALGLEESLPNQPGLRVTHSDVVHDPSGIRSFQTVALTVTKRDGTPVGWDNLEIWVDASSG
jgi:hypothetical protein